MQESRYVHSNVCMYVFEGGLPPNGTAHSSDSLGQGNSKVRLLVVLYYMGDKRNCRPDVS